MNQGHIKQMDIDKRIKILELRNQGLSFNKISDVLGSSRQLVWILYNRSIKHGFSLEKLRKFRLEKEQK